MTLLALEHVHKSYRRGTRAVTALADVSLEVACGELVSVWGGDRSGKTTLLRIAAGLERPDRGRVRFEGDSDERRRCWVQASPLAARHAILDYVALPLLAAGVPARAAHARARHELARVGALACADLRGAELDAGELLRVALAQALVRRPRLLIVDEPTRNLDVLEREPTIGLLRALADTGVAVLMTTGEAVGVAGADRALTLADGKVRAHVAAASARVVALRSWSGAPTPDTIV